MVFISLGVGKHLRHGNMCGYNLMGWFIYKQKGYPTLENVHIYVIHGD